MTYGVFTDQDRARARDLQAAHLRFVLQQVKAGNDPATPADRPDPSDYNQHGAELEADPAAQQRYYNRLAKIMGDDRTITAAADVQTGAMVALVPSSQWASGAAIDHPAGEPIDRMHMTSVYLGDAANWSDADRFILLSAASEAASGMPPFSADVLGPSIFNPSGAEPAIVAGITGQGAADAQAQIAAAMRPFASRMPQQHVPQVCHVTLAYADADHFADYMDHYAAVKGPVNFDRLRVVFAGEVFDFPLSGSTMIPEIAAAAPGGAQVTEPAEPNPEPPDAVQIVPIGLYGVPPEAEGGTPFVGVCCVEGEWTGDGRQFAVNSLYPAPLPWSLKWQPAEDTGHTGSVIVGRVDTFERVGNLIQIAGVMDDGPGGGEFGCEAARLMARQMLRGSSVCVDDFDQADIETVYPNPITTIEQPMDVPPDAPPGVDLEPNWQPDVYVDPGQPQEIVHSARVRSVTLLPEPAFVEAIIQLVQPGDVVTDSTPAGSAQPPVSITAAGHTITLPDVPPAWWFDRPDDVVMATAFTITDDGRVYGRLAPANTAHRAYRGRRLTVPEKVDYSRFLGRQTIVAGGGRLVTGVVTMDCGHCPPGLSSDPAVRAQHYDNSCSVVASINIGDDPVNGPWVAGALLPGVTAEQVAAMQACVLSGDWAPHPEKPGQMEFVAALLVPVPGFPMPGNPDALALAASGEPIPDHLRPAVTLRFNEQTGTANVRVPVLLASAGPRRDYSQAMDRLARSIGYDPEARTAQRFADLRRRVQGGGE